MAERAEADSQIEGPREGQRAGVSTHPVHRHTRRIPVRGSRRGEHGRAEIDAGDPFTAHFPKNAHPGSGAAADVEPGAERAERTNRTCHRVEQASAGPERRPVEFRSKQVVPVLGG
jgi:hypothetical protein